MSDLPPDPDLPTTPSEPVATPPPAAEPAATMPSAPPPPTVTYGQVPGTVNEVYYKTVANVLLTIITCGIWFGVYAYRTHGDLKRYNGEGMGELAGLQFAVDEAQGTVSLADGRVLVLATVAQAVAGTDPTTWPAVVSRTFDVLLAP